ncbi:hypothetical protein HX787_10825 [Pseudomonas tolaasii]|uniref:Uncharacterized protein n=2 Tax=Pseudomonas tolaasii TaxID=29442 RepID=A0A7Y8ALM0_PSETO|nr:hypothetical protein [Pseudomonas tolaasii]ARB26198.1 hypothetical protein B5P22_02470 [Pseudomonas tolaasii]KAB0478516.1 hypothetical protein F7R12_04490 [Pseudomonas tolaasii]NWC23297.1 hypothetical protein [Pseudomonas tolaasii]NWC37822.1 hypothetical protein [Pseudomonas tolaasii]NWD36342.1 hypothetical protein [Pseudomonas tolaasii]
MDMPKSAEEIRELLLSQHPDLKDDLAKISDFELLQCLLCAYECAIEIKEAELMEADAQLDAAARAIFSPVPH